MSRPRSPSYPNFPLEKALTMAYDIFASDRRHIIDRETAAKHIGYSGLSGSSDKALATLGQYNLLEKAGKGQARVTQNAMDILHPDSERERKSALFEAGMAPEIFKEIMARFPDGPPSESALSSWLKRENFLDRAIGPIVRSYTQTYSFLQQEGALESDEISEESDIKTGGVSEINPAPLIKHHDNNSPQVPAAPVTLPNTVPIENGFSEWFRAKVGSDRLITINHKGKGEIGPREIEKLILMLEAQKVALED